MGLDDGLDTGLARGAPVKRVSPSSSEEGPLIEGPGKFGKRYKVCNGDNARGTSGHRPCFIPTTYNRTYNQSQMQQKGCNLFHFDYSRSLLKQVWVSVSDKLTSAFPV